MKRFIVETHSYVENLENLRTLYEFPVWASEGSTEMTFKNEIELNDYIGYHFPDSVELPDETWALTTVKVSGCMCWVPLLENGLQVGKTYYRVREYQAGQLHQVECSFVVKSNVKILVCKAQYVV